MPTELLATPVAIQASIDQLCELYHAEKNKTKKHQTSGSQTPEDKLQHHQRGSI